MVSLSSQDLARASTVILRDRSPFATAVVDRARCCAPGSSGCRHARSRCRSGPSTCRRRRAPSAWPPSTPSVPTSRATRVTSLDERAELIHHPVDRRTDAEELALDLLAVDLELDFLRQVPSATALITRDTSVVGCTRSAIRLLTASTGTCPGAVRREADAIGHVALAAHREGDAPQLFGQPLVPLRDSVEHLDDFRHQGVAVPCEPSRGNRRRRAPAIRRAVVEVSCCAPCGAPRSSSGPRLLRGARRRQWRRPPSRLCVLRFCVRHSLRRRRSLSESLSRI